MINAVKISADENFASVVTIRALCVIPPCLLGEGAELMALRRMIIDKTQGNPLFMEEIVQALVEDGSLERDGTARLVRPVEQLSIPPTVQGILAARIDNLPPE